MASRTSLARVDENSYDPTFQQMEADRPPKKKKREKKPLLVDTATKRFQSSPAHKKALKAKLDKINGVEKTEKQLPPLPPLVAPLLPPAVLELPVVADVVPAVPITVPLVQSTLSKCVEMAQAATPGVSEKGKLQRELQGILALFAMRTVDLAPHIPVPETPDVASPTTAYDAPAPIVQQTPVLRTLRTFHEAVEVLSAKLQRYNTHAFPLRKKKRIWKLFGDVEEAWRDLMIQLTFSVARDSSATATTASGNVAKLAVATGAPDWAELTIDDAQKMFIQGDKYLLGFGVTRSYDIAFKRYMAAAKLGSVEATNMLGVMYEHGLGRPMDMASAIKRSHPEALAHMARIHEAGKGVPKDPTTAHALYLLAAEGGHLDSMCSLGALIESGNGCVANPVEAVRWYRLAAEQDCARGQNALGSAYYRGVGVERNYGEAVMWYRKAAESGDPNAHNNLGICYEEGLGVAKDYAMAKMLYKLAAEARHPSGVNNWGFLCMLEKNFLEAIQHFHLAMSLHSIDAAYNLGQLYEMGCRDSDGVVLNRDLATAMRYYKEAADKNYTKAQIRLSTLYMISEPPYRDYAAAQAYLTKAALSGGGDGNAEAQNMLGEMVELGMGGTDSSPDHAAAAKWYRKAMRQGHARAMWNLAALYEGGFGVGKDMEKALRLYKEAETRGSKDAQVRLRQLFELGVLPRKKA
ncbi:hypothetical protein HDU88_004902 [Geranomyces variabilis]|nr:hypothetical protein HDU88_004902 [Geranomyces variabilis]